MAEPLVVPIDFFLTENLENFNRDDNWYSRLHAYQERLILTFNIVMKDQIGLSRMKLATHAILEYYGVNTGKKTDVAECIQKYGTKYFGYALDPIEFEWFISPLAMIGMANKKYPKMDDCDGQAVTVACMLASVGVEPFLTFLAVKTPFIFCHVLTSISHETKALGVETINKTGEYPFGSLPPWETMVLRSPYSKFSHLFIKPNIAKEFKMKNYYYLII